MQNQNAEMLRAVLQILTPTTGSSMLGILSILIISKAHTSALQHSSSNNLQNHKPTKHHATNAFDHSETSMMFINHSPFLVSSLIALAIVTGHHPCLVKASSPKQPRRAQQEDLADAVTALRRKSPSQEDCFTDVDEETSWSICVQDCGRKLTLVDDADEEACPASSSTMQLAWPQTASMPVWKPKVTYVAGQTIYMSKDGQNDDRQIAMCPDDSYATGGGWLRVSGNMEANIAYDGPIIDEGTDDAVGWQVRLEAEGTGDWIKSQTYVLCISFSA